MIATNTFTWFMLVFPMLDVSDIVTLQSFVFPWTAVVVCMHVAWMFVCMPDSLDINRHFAVNGRGGTRGWDRRGRVPCVDRFGDGLMWRV